jgi:hypothetical protein
MIAGDTAAAQAQPRQEAQVAPLPLPYLEHGAGPERHDQLATAVPAAARRVYLP